MLEATSALQAKTSATADRLKFVHASKEADLALGKI